MGSRINVLLSTLPGLDRPKTLCLPLPAQYSAYEFWSLVTTLLPDDCTSHIRLTTTGNREVLPRKDVHLADIARGRDRDRDYDHDRQHDIETAMLPIRMNAVLVGGKGGFGSQLRAAGGRMSSRKKRQNAELATGSARNLDGRRLRTITEAKNLATYLATKPDMDRREKEERRKRWEQVIELAEQREADMKAGKGADGRRKGLSEEWIEEKEEVGENVKHAVKLAMAAQEDADKQHDEGSDHSPSASVDDDSEDEEPMELDETDMAKLTKEAEAGDPDALWVLRHKLKIPSALLPKQRHNPRKFAGFDDDITSSEDENDTEDDTSTHDNVKGKTVIRS